MKHLITEETINVKINPYYDFIWLFNRCHFPAVYWSIPYSHSSFRKTGKQDRQVCSHLTFSNLWNDAGRDTRQIARIMQGGSLHHSRFFGNVTAVEGTNKEGVNVIWRWKGKVFWWIKAPSLGLNSITTAWHWHWFRIDFTCTKKLIFRFAYFRWRASIIGLVLVAISLCVVCMSWVIVHALTN